MFTVSNHDIAIHETVQDEPDAFDLATGLAEDYPGRRFYIHYVGKPYAVVWQQGGWIHVDDLYRPVTASLIERLTRQAGTHRTAKWETDED